MNQNIDEGFLKPLAESWQIVLPVEIRDCLGNAFFNLRGPSTVINNLLQGKPAESLSDAGRFLVNTTVGLLGCIDVASKMGLEIHREDFGQTLGVWGFGPGPYLVVPVFGPSSGRVTDRDHPSPQTLSVGLGRSANGFRQSIVKRLGSMVIRYHN